MSSPDQYAIFPNDAPRDGAPRAEYLPAAPPATKPLYTAAAVTLATVFGGPLAGYWIMATNYRRMGKSAEARNAIAAGVLIDVLVVGAGLLLPSEFQSAALGVNIALIFFLRKQAQKEQGAAVEEHLAQGGREGSLWAAFGVGIASCLLVIGIALGFIFAPTLLSPSITVGLNDKVIYSGSAARQDAELLGQALRADGFFHDKGIVVRLSKSSAGTTVSFSVKDGLWDDEQYVSNVEVFGREIAPAVGGSPFTIRLLDSAGITRKEIRISEPAGS
jgi:hypothetical protein